MVPGSGWPRTIRQGALIDDVPWSAVDYRTSAGADVWLLALRAYAFEGMIEADFRPKGNTVCL